MIRALALSLAALAAAVAFAQAPPAASDKCTKCDALREQAATLRSLADRMRKDLGDERARLDPSLVALEAQARTLDAAAEKMSNDRKRATSPGMREYLITETALCTACVPAYQVYAEVSIKYEEISDRVANLYDDIEVANVQLDQSRKHLAALQDYMEKAQAKVDSPQTPQDFKAIYRAAIGDAEALIRQVRENIEASREEIAQLRVDLARAEKEYDVIERDFNAKRLALVECNTTRCVLTDEVLIERVIGSGGNNPFDPGNPVGGVDVPPPAPPASSGALQFSSATYGGAEGGAVLVVVMRTGGSRGAVTVAYATAPGTASQADFTAANGTLTWADGDASSKSFSIALIDDTQVESTEAFTVSLSGPTGGATLGSPATATISIADNDSPTIPQPPGAIQFSSPTYSVMENAGTVTITVTRVGGSAGEVTVQYFTGASSATPGSDYQQANGVLSWGVGDTGAKSFTVAIINDTLVEGPETFFVTLNNPTGGATLGAPATATVTIIDDDVNTGPCGPTGNAWTPNAGSYACNGSCSPNPSPRLSINGDLVTATQFASGGTATFQGCGQSLNSRETNLTYFGQSNHRATITRGSDTTFNANIVSSGGGTCAFSCTRTGP